MSGHSKWASIKHQKGAADKKRGKLFSVLSKRISIAAKSGKYAETNPSLKMAIEKAKAANMPVSTIEKAIKRGAGELPGQGPIEEVVYEAYGKGGVQIIIVGSTDNKNRTTANVRHILSKNGASLGQTGSVMWNFDRNGDEFQPKTKQEVNQDTFETLNKLIVQIEEDEDVEKVYSNINF